MRTVAHSEAVFRPMPGEIRQMRIRQADKRLHRAELKDSSSRERQFRRHEDFAVVGEADKPAIECSVPKGREQQSVMDIESQRVFLAIRPRDDV